MPNVVVTQTPGKSGSGEGAQAYGSQSSIESQLAAKIGAIQQLASNASLPTAVAKINEILSKFAIANFVNATSLSSESSESSESSVSSASV